MFLLSLFKPRTIKNYQDFLVKHLEDQCNIINIKQKVRIKIQQTSIDNFLNQTLYELTDYSFILQKSNSQCNEL